MHYDVYLSTLTRYVAALGGHLEIQAVFPDETITVLREPTANEPAPASAAISPAAMAAAVSND